MWEPRWQLNSTDSAISSFVYDGNRCVSDVSFSAFISVVLFHHSKRSHITCVRCTHTTQFIISSFRHIFVSRLSSIYVFIFVYVYLFSINIHHLGPFHYLIFHLLLPRLSISLSHIIQWYCVIVIVHQRNVLHAGVCARVFAFLFSISNIIKFDIYASWIELSGKPNGIGHFWCISKT